MESRNYFIIGFLIAFVLFLSVVSAGKCQSCLETYSDQGQKQNYKYDNVMTMQPRNNVFSSPQIGQGPWERQGNFPRVQPLRDERPRRQINNQPMNLIVQGRFVRDVPQMQPPREPRPFWIFRIRD